MAIINWTADFVFGINEIDEQHKKWINLINKSHEYIDKGKKRNMIIESLKELIEYSKIHIKKEEYYMEKFEYPGFEEHKKEHNLFIQKVKTLMDKYRKNDSDLDSEIMDFLIDWLLHHIQVVDKKYVPLFKTKGL